VDRGVGSVGDEAQAIVFCLDQFLTDFGAGLFLCRCAGSDARCGEKGDEKRYRRTCINYELLIT
jgi:hypothetical protein